MDDKFSFVQAHNPERPYRNLRRLPCSEPIKQVIEAYIGNLKRAEASISFPLYLAGRAMHLQRAFDVGTQKAHSKFFPVGAGVDEASAPFMHEALADAEKLADHGLDCEWIGQRCVDWIIAGSSNTDTGVEGLLSARIVAVWTAFETLTGDLWEAALNSSAKCVACFSADKDVKFSELVEMGGGDFDFRNKMGTLLRRKFVFSRLDDSRKAYRSVFKKYSENIDSALMDHSVDALNLVRNLLVHRGGVVDSKYLDDVGKLSGTSAPILPEGQKLLLTGALVTSMVEPVIGRGAFLIQSVIRWIRDEEEGRHTPGGSGPKTKTR